MPLVLFDVSTKRVTSYSRFFLLPSFLPSFRLPLTLERAGGEGQCMRALFEEEERKQ